jgi:hypothetical protein
MNASGNRDYEHLRLLSVFHYVLGGTMVAISMIPLVHVGLGFSFLTSPETFLDENGNPPPALMGWLFIIIGGVVIFAGLTLAVCLILSGRFLAKRKGYWFSFVIACIECLNAPIGTLLGVFTLVVLSRQSVKEMYGIVPPSDASA